MENLFSELKDLLKKDTRLVLEGELLKNRVTELALKLDKDLLKLLLSHKRLKEHFFTDVDGVLVFDKEKFMRFVNNKEFLPDSYTTFKNKVGLSVGENYLTETKEVVLSWAYKDTVLEGGQTEQDVKRKEIFWNEILAPDEIDRLLAPKVFTNWKRYGKKDKQTGKQVQFFDDDNLIIKGNNLLALHSLKKRFAGQVNLIYIDPPYNTGNDEFQYNDSFNHSTWLTFMKNRLEIARKLLAPNGSIYVHLDFNEVHYAKVLMDEIFGEENFQREIIWRMGWVSGYKTIAKNWIRNHDNILFYVQNSKDFVFNKKYLPYPEDYERWGGREKGQGLVIEDVWGIHVGEGLNSLGVVSFAKEYTGFRTQKPESLLKRIIEVSTNKGDLVMDFCLGTGTTASVAHKLGRRYIGIEQLDYGDKDSRVRMKNVIDGDTTGISKDDDVKWKGGGSFVYCELMEWNEKFAEAILKANKKQTLQVLWKEMQTKANLSYRIDLKQFKENEKGFEELSLEDQKSFLMEVLDKNSLYVNLSEMEDESYGVNEEDKNLNRQFYSL